MSKKMLIDATHPEETRVVVLDGNKVEDFDFESVNKRQLAGNIYLAKVTRVEPSLQAAFVEYGGNRHGFLAFSEIHPDYYQIPVADREALLAEEARHAEDENAEDDNESDGSRRGRSSRGGRRQRRNNGSSTESDSGSDSGSVSGLEVIDLSENEDGDGETASEDAPAGLEVADAGRSVNAPASERAPRTRSRRKSSERETDAAASADEPVEAVAETESGAEEAAPEDGAAADLQAANADELKDSAAEDATPAPADPVPDTAETSSSEPDQEPGEPVATEVSATEAAPEADTNPDETAATPDDQPAENDEEAESPDSPPRYMAESAGLGDDERLTEELDAADRKQDDAPDAETAEEEEAPTPDPAIPAEASTNSAEAEAANAPTNDAPATDEPLASAVPAETEAGDAGTAEPTERTEAVATESAASQVEPALVEHTESTAPSADAQPSEGTAETGGAAPAEEDVAGEAMTADTESTDQSASGTEAQDEDQPSRGGRRRSRRRSDRRSGQETAASTDENGDRRAENGGNGSGRGRNANTADRNGKGNGDANDNGNDDEVEDIGADDALEEAAGVRARLSRRYKIQDVIKVRQIMLVQVVKEERGTKGAALTTYLSLAGRYCVLMPNTARGGGISRKITNVSDRKRLREIAGELDVPRGMGLIIRTAGAERTRAEIRRDYEFLLRQWERVRDLTLKSIAPTLIYEEGSLIKRSIRDLYSREIEQVLVEGEAGYREAKEYMRVLMPSHARNVQPYTDTIPLFSRYQVESYLNGMFSPRVPLKSGGYLVIGITEALVAIDVNSGRATKQSSIEETALHTNLEAAEEVARQLRLRDLAGLIVIDFIDMDEGRNNRAVEKRLKEKLKSDRARIQIGRISAFGLLEMSRQRLRPGMLEATTRPCPHCHGSGLIRSDDSLALAILREVEEEALRGRTNEINVHAPVEIANYLVNIKRQHIAQIEARTQISVMVTADPSLISPDYEVERCKGERKQPAPAARDVVSASAVALPETAEELDVVETVSGDVAPASEREERQGGDEDRSRRRRGRRGGRRRRGESSDNRDQPQAGDNQATDTEQKSAGDGAGDGAEQQQTAESGREQSGNEEERGRSRRGRGRRRRGRRNDEQQQNAARADAGDGDAAPEEIAGDTGQKHATAASTESGTAGAMSSDSAPETADTPDTAQPEETAPPRELQAGDGSTAAAEQDAEGAPVRTGDTSADEEAPAAKADAPDAAAQQAAGAVAASSTGQKAEDAPAKADEPIELHAGDGSTAAAGQDQEASASGQAETPDADVPAETADRREAVEEKTSAGEQDAQQADITEAASAPEPTEEKAPQPKRRGWWSLGL